MDDSTDDLLRKIDKEWQEHWFPPLQSITLGGAIVILLKLYGWA